MVDVSIGIALDDEQLLPSPGARRPAEHAPTTTIPSHHVLRSTLQPVRAHPVLLRWGLYQAAMFGAFSAFWTTVSFNLNGPRFR